MLITESVTTTDLQNGKSDYQQVDLRYGAQDGYLPKLANEEGYEEWLNHAAYLRNDLIPIPIRVPAFFGLIGDNDIKKKLTELWVEIFTVHAKSITGFDRTLTIETADNDFGTGNNTQQEFVKATRARSSITYAFTEKLGKPIQEFLEFLIEYGVRDSETKSALVGTIESARKALKGKIYLPHYFTGTILYAELDLVNVNVTQAWLTANIAPLTAGADTAQRNLQEAATIATYEVPITGITICTKGTRRLAQAFIDNSTIFTNLPEDAPIFAHSDDYNLVNQGNGGFNQNPVKVTPEKK